MEFNTFKISDIADVQTGPFGSQLHKEDYVAVGTPIITVEHLGENKIIHSNLPKVKREDWQRLSKYVLKENDIVFSRVGSVDRCALVSEKENNWLFSGRCLRVRVKDTTKVAPKYLSYYFSSKKFKSYIRSIAVGATMPSINTKILSEIKIKLPDIFSQRKISKLLYQLDSKIWCNEQLIKKLEQIAQTLFKRWFIDFEFPNEEGKPYKSSGGEMVESELGDIPNLFNTGILADIYQNFDSKRKPLSKMERLKREKVYPYYGAASLMDFVDDYLFDGIYLLLGEDGTVQTKEGYPVLQLVDGKFWVNNHAHVMQGATGFLTEYLYIMLKNINIKNIITGAVQPKISQRNLNNIKIIIPDEKSIEAFQKNIKLIFEEILNLRKENKNLTQLRDTLLPKLLSGEIEIPDDLEV